MPLKIKNRAQDVLAFLLSLIIATGLWYFVVARDHVETQISIRLEYRGLPKDFIPRNGLPNELSVRLAGSAELMRNLHSMDLVHTVDLSEVQKGANALPLQVSEIPALRHFDVKEIKPNRLVVEMDVMTKRVIPLLTQISPMPEDSPYAVSHAVLNPSFVTVQGPESQVNMLENLSVPFNPALNASEGSHEASVAIPAPSELQISPPVATLRYALDLKMTDIPVKLPIQLDADKSQFIVTPSQVELLLSVPSSLAKDKDYLETIRVMTRVPAYMSLGSTTESPVVTRLPSGAKLKSIQPSFVTIQRKNAEQIMEWKPGRSTFVLPNAHKDISFPEIKLPSDSLFFTPSSPQELQSLPALPLRTGDATEIPSLSKEPILLAPDSQIPLTPFHDSGGTDIQAPSSQQSTILPNQQAPSLFSGKGLQEKSTLKSPFANRIGTDQLENKREVKLPGQFSSMPSGSNPTLLPPLPVPMDKDAQKNHTPSSDSSKIGSDAGRANFSVTNGSSSSPSLNSGK